mmetsp:Transcript_6546/g.16173  ORF Transcript_6546/g.16173 Transcript_6546/m.16173 type:complete len:237 (-) Transcript_6546:1181-1891(-)
MSFTRHSFNAITRTGRPLHQRSKLPSAPKPSRPWAGNFPRPPACTIPLALRAGVTTWPELTAVGRPTPSCPSWFEPKAKIVPRRTSCMSPVMPPSGAWNSRWLPLPCDSLLKTPSSIPLVEGREDVNDEPGFKPSETSTAVLGGGARGMPSPSEQKLSTSWRCHQDLRTPSVHKGASLAHNTWIISFSSNDLWRPPFNVCASTCPMAMFSATPGVACLVDGCHKGGPHMNGQAFLV